MNRLLLLILIIACASCSFFDTLERKPMFLLANEVSLTTKPGEGANTHKIRDLSIYLDGFNIGFFNVPADIPVLDEDNESLIEAIAGIRNNGNAVLPVEYPFYSIESLNTTFEEEKMIPFNINFGYKEGVKFKLVEGFENAVHEFNGDLDDNPDTNVEIVTEARSGSFAGKISNSADNPNFEFSTSFRYPVSDIDDTQVFLELDYKNDIPFQVGVLGFNNQLGRRDYKIVLVERDEWNKIYIELTNEIANSGIEEFQLIMRNATEPGQYGSVWIDNVKLVHL